MRCVRHTGWKYVYVSFIGCRCVRLTDGPNPNERVVVVYVTAVLGRLLIFSGADVVYDATGGRRFRFADHRLPSKYSSWVLCIKQGVNSCELSHGDRYFRWFMFLFWFYSFRAHLLARATLRRASDLTAPHPNRSLARAHMHTV